MEIGDAVEFEQGDDVLIVGEVVRVYDDRCSVVEAHAFHRLWGGSNGSRGEEHQLEQRVVKPVRSGWKHVVKEGMATYRRNPEKWDRQREENERLAKEAT